VRSASVHPINSVLFISDTDCGTVPIMPNRDATAWSTESCVSFRCYPEQDGPTEINLGPVRDVDPGGVPVFNGEIETPTGKLLVWTVDDETVLEAAAPGPRTRLRIWMDDLRWPEQVIVGYE
jgi:hypothetical protein